jgi:hypothetical protein
VGPATLQMLIVSREELLLSPYIFITFRFQISLGRLMSNPLHPNSPTEGVEVERQGLTKVCPCPSGVCEARLPG